MEEERTDALSEFVHLRNCIRPLFTLLKMSPRNELEKFIYESVEKPSEEHLTSQSIASCQILFQELSGVAEQKRNEIVETCEEFIKLYNELKSEENYNLHFTLINGSEEVKKQFEAIINTLKRIKTEKENRIEECIVETREEIEIICQSSFIAPEEYSDFEPHLKSTQFTQTLLNIHYDQLKKWKKYQADNQKIFNNINKLYKLLAVRNDLELKLEDPNRFQNRGASLLKDSNQLNSVTKKLGIIEKELIDLASQFQTKNGKKIKINGREVEQLIKENHENYEKQKMEKKGKMPPKADSSRVTSSRKSVYMSNSKSAKRPPPQPSSPKSVKKLKLPHQ